MIMRHAVAAVLLPALLAAGAAVAQNAAPDAAPQIGQVSKDSVWVPTPERMIRRMFQMADTTRDDVVIDLGSGDGRMPIYAAKHFGARGIGVELEPNLVRVSLAAARAQGVSHLTEFLQQDLFAADLSRATVIALYISPGVMTRLKPRLLALRPGVRVVSHHFTLEDWESDETIRVENRTGYLWVVPADVRGRWRVSLSGDEIVVAIEQKHQMLATSGSRGGRPVNVIGARLRGTEISFTAFDRDGNSRQYRGRVDGARMAGEAAGDGAAPLAWSAVRE
ncbi:MAG: SAM-dependent methyltransferase [Burkholderiales bacterium]|nr:SAM-dependent methyltransferase [Burkholderiales bacterium]